MGRKVVWIAGAALALALLATPAAAQVSVAVGVGVPGVSANVVYGAPPVYAPYYGPPYAVYPPYPYAYPYYYAPAYPYRYPVYGPKYYRGRPGYYYGRAPYYRGAPRYYGNNYYNNRRVPDSYRGVGAMAYPDPRTTGRNYRSNAGGNATRNVRSARGNGRR